MLKKLTGLILAILILVLLACTALLALAHHDATRLLPVLKTFSGYHINAEQLQLKLWPLRAAQLNASNLEVHDSENRPVLRADSVLANVDLVAAQTAWRPFWSLEAGHIDILVQPPETEAPAPEEPAEALDFSRILAVNTLRIARLSPSGQHGPQYAITIQREADQQLRVDVAEAQSFRVQGRLHHQGGLRRDRLEWQASELDLRPFLQSDSAAANTDASLAEATPMNWSWLGMLRKLDIKLSIDKLLLADDSLQQVAAELSFGAAEIGLHSLSAVWAPPESEPGRWTVQAQLKPLAVNTQQADLTGSVSIAGEGLSADYDGQINLNGVNAIAGALMLKVQKNNALQALLPILPVNYLPLNFSSQLATENDSIELQQMKMQFGQSDLGGKLRLGLDGDAPAVSGKLHSTVLHIANTEQPAAETQAAEEAAVQPSRLIPESPIDWSWLQRTLLDISLQAKSLHIYAAQFSDFQLQLQGSAGKLSVEPFAAQFGGGGFEGAATLEQLDDDQARIDSRFSMSGVDLEAFQVVSTDELSGGKTRLELAISGQGRSAADIAASANGVVHLLVHDAVIQNDSIELIGSDFIMEILEKLNPFAKSDPKTTLHCALVHFDIKNGVMQSDKSLVMETDKMEIIGDGKIELADESIAIGITPNAKQGVGINVGSVVKFMKLGGTLSKPSPAVDGAGLLKSGASIGAAISTGGLSILAESAVKKISKQNACREALQGS